MDMSKAIREGRDRLGMSQEALAERLGVSRQAVSKWEMGTSVPSPENRRALSEILGTDLQVERETAPPVPLRRWKRLTLAAGSPYTGAGFELWINGQHAGDIAVPETGGFDRFTPCSLEVSIPEMATIALVYRRGKNQEAGVDYLLLE